jgi:phosphoribosylformylglycinamidine cyclo-ligase
LIRKVIERTRADLSAPFVRFAAKGSASLSLGEVLLEPTRIYVKPVLALLKTFSVHGMAHITGGGLVENVHRMFPGELAAEIQATSWDVPAAFEWIQGAGGISESEMHRTFNCGIGFVLVIAAADVPGVLASLNSAGERASVIGRVIEREPGMPGTMIV